MDKILVEKVFVTGVKFCILYELEHGRPPKREDTQKAIEEYMSENGWH